MKPTKAKTARNEAMLALKEAQGLSNAEIGRMQRPKITGARVGQVIKRQRVKRAKLSEKGASNV